MGAGRARAAVVAIVFMTACDPAEPMLQPRYFVPPDADTVDPGNPTPNDGGVTPTGADGGGLLVDGGPDPGGFEPSLLPLTGWWRASFDKSPWVGRPSAGGSGGRDLSEPTTPPIAGAPVAGLTPATFDGTKSQLVSPVAMATFLSANAWEVDGLFSADAAPPATAGSAYLSPAIVTDTLNGFFYVAYGSVGVIAGHYDGATFKEVTSPCPTGGLHAFQAWFDGAKLHLIIDGGIPANPVTAGAAVLSSGTIKVGTNYTHVATLNGRIFEILTSASVFDDTSRTNVRLYFNRRYGTTFR